MTLGKTRDRNLFGYAHVRVFDYLRHLRYACAPPWRCSVVKNARQRPRAGLVSPGNVDGVAKRLLLSHMFLLALRRRVSSAELLILLLLLLLVRVDDPRRRRGCGKGVINRVTRHDRRGLALGTSHSG